jgi:hypothetical protein
MEAKERTKLASRMAQLEEIWATFDELFASFEPEDWSRRHGPDWIFADVPYHMYFFDQEFIADAIEKSKKGQTCPPLSRWPCTPWAM